MQQQVVAADDIYKDQIVDQFAFGRRMSLIMLVVSHSDLEIVFYIIAQQKEKPASFDDAGFYYFFLL